MIGKMNGITISKDAERRYIATYDRDCPAVTVYPLDEMIFVSFKSGDGRRICPIQFKRKNIVIWDFESPTGDRFLCCSYQGMTVLDNNGVGYHNGEIIDVDNELSLNFAKLLGENYWFVVIPKDALYVGPGWGEVENIFEPFEEMVVWKGERDYVVVGKLSLKYMQDGFVMNGVTNWDIELSLRSLLASNKGMLLDGQFVKGEFGFYPYWGYAIMKKMSEWEVVDALPVDTKETDGSIPEYVCKESGIEVGKLKFLGKVLM